MLKQVFLARFEPVVTHFGPWKVQNALKMGSFGTKDGSKMGQKHIVPKVTLDHLGCAIKCNEPILSPLGAILAPLRSQKTLKMGHFVKKNWSKMGQKCVLPKMILDHLGC